MRGASADIDAKLDGAASRRTEVIGTPRKAAPLGSRTDGGAARKGGAKHAPGPGPATAGLRRAGPRRPPLLDGRAPRARRRRGGAG